VIRLTWFSLLEYAQKGTFALQDNSTKLLPTLGVLLDTVLLVPWLIIPAQMAKF
jgi:hypothetical protein